MTKNSLIIQQYEIGPLNNFLYLLGDPETKEMAIVDPAWSVPFLCQEAKRLGYTITKAFLTHTHPDHINGLGQLLEIYNVPVYISRHEPVSLRKNLQNLIEVDDKDKIQLGSITFKVLHTPGHTPGCQCFYVETKGQSPALFSGDTFFIDGCGRCDLPGGDPVEMYNTLYNIIKKLPDETIVYPGHNYGSLLTDTIANQKRTNPYLQANNLKEFLEERMG